MRKWIIVENEKKGESYKYFLDKKSQISSECNISPEDVTMLFDYDCADIISVELVSAACIVHKVKNQIAYDKDYYIKLESYQSGWKVVSKEYYKKDEALKIAAKFMDLNTNVAKKIWDLKGYGGNNIFYIA